MTRLKSAIVAILLMSASPMAWAADPHGHATHHDSFYRHLKQPGTTASCCNNQDCRPAKHRITPTGVDFFINGQWIRPPSSRMMEVETPDAGAHWCGIETGTYPITYCAIIPRGGV